MSSTTKLHSSQELQSNSVQYQLCPRCRSNEEIYIQLECGHEFCIVCVTFAYLKFKNSLQSDEIVKCVECGQLSELDSETIEMIDEIISKELKPIMDQHQEEDVRGEERNGDGGVQQSIYGDGHHGDQSGTKLSQEQHHLSSFADKMVTEGGDSSHLKGNEEGIVYQHALKSSTNNPKNNYNQSRVSSNEKVQNQSPSAYPSSSYSPFNNLKSQPNSSSYNCQFHPNEQFAYICLTCNFRPLCYRCINSTTNSHNNHEIKMISKAIDYVDQRLSLGFLEMKETLENLKLTQKRLSDRKLLFADKINRNIVEVEELFRSLMSIAERKLCGILENYRNFYQELSDQIDCESEKAEKYIGRIEGLFSGASQRVDYGRGQIKNQENQHISSQFGGCQLEYLQSLKTDLQHYEELRRNHILEPCSPHRVWIENYEQLLEPINGQSVQLTQELSKIMESIERISLKEIDFEEEHSLSVKANNKRSNAVEMSTYGQFNYGLLSSLKSTEPFNKNKTMMLKNRSSRNFDRMGRQEDSNEKGNGNGDREYFKRIKTNIVSLNTSRDKRQQQYTTKTEEDQKRIINKSKHNNAHYRTQANTQSKNPVDKHELPSYIERCLNKHQNNDTKKISAFNGGTMATQLFDKLRHGSRNVVSNKASKGQGVHIEEKKKSKIHHKQCHSPIYGSNGNGNGRGVKNSINRDRGERKTVGTTPSNGGNHNLKGGLAGIFSKNSKVLESTYGKKRKMQR